MQQITQRRLNNSLSSSKTTITCFQYLTQNNAKQFKYGSNMTPTSCFPFFDTLDKFSRFKIFKHRCSVIFILIKYPDMNSCSGNRSIQLFQFRVQNFVFILVKCKWSRPVTRFKNACKKKIASLKTSIQCEHIYFFCIVSFFC